MTKARAFTYRDAFAQNPGWASEIADYRGTHWIRHRAYRHHSIQKIVQRKG